MYVTTVACCFYSYIFGWEQRLVLHWKDITAITKEKTAIFIPNAIQLATKDAKFFFASFVDRDSTHMMLMKLWQAAVNDQFLSDEDIDQIIACNYGEGEDDEDQMTEPEEVVDTLVMPAEVPDDESEQEDLDSEVQTILDTWLEDAGGSIVCDKTLNRSLPDLYNLLYTNSNFFFTFHKDRGSTELEIGDWEEQEAEKCFKLREVSYNMSLNNPVGPKKCQVKEIQKMSRSSVIEDKIYCIETEAENSGVPYADSFTVVTNSCLVRLGPEKARFIAKAEITFKKDLWSFLKDKIEANAWSGITGYYSQLASSLESYSASVPEQAQARRDGARIRKHSSMVAREEQQWSSILSGPQSLLLCLLLLLLFTSFLNTVALFRLSAFVDTTVSSMSSPVLPKRPRRTKDTMPRSQEEWMSLLEQQTEFYTVRSSWLKQKLVQATSHLAKAEKELERLGVELEKMEAKDWMQVSDIKDTDEETNCDNNEEMEYCDKED